MRDGNGLVNVKIADAAKDSAFTTAAILAESEQQRRLEMFRLVESNLQAQFDSMSSTWRVRPTALLLNRSST